MLPLTLASRHRWLRDRWFVCLVFALFVRTSFLSLPAPHPSQCGGWGFCSLMSPRVAAWRLCPASQVRKPRATHPSDCFLYVRAAEPPIQPPPTPPVWLVLCGRTLGSDTPISSLISARVTYVLNQNAFQLSECSLVGGTSEHRAMRRLSGHIPNTYKKSVIGKKVGSRDGATLSPFWSMRDMANCVTSREVRLTLPCPQWTS